LLAYALAVALPAFVLFFRLVVMNFKAGDPPALILFLLPVMICAYVGGIQQGLFATLFAALAGGYFLLPPFHTLAIENWIHHVQWLSMVTEGILISLLVESLHRTRRQSEQANLKLHEQQARLAGVISSALDGIITVDTERCITLFNSGAEKMFNCSAAEAVGHPLDRFIPERFREYLTTHLQQFASTQITHQMLGSAGTLCGLRASGSTTGEEFPIEVSISQVDLAGQKLFTAIVRDMTEHRRAEAELRRGRDRLSLAMDVAKLGTWELYIPDETIEWSPLALAAFGLPPAAKMNYQQYMDMLHPEDREKMVQARQETRRTNQDFEVELRTIWADGSVHWITVHGRPYPDELGRPQRASGILQEITQQKRAEEMLLRSQKLESLGTLAGGIAHDFNNILLAIRGNAMLAAEDLSVNHPAQQSLLEISKGARRATDLVRQILAFSRPQDQKRQTLQLETVVVEAVKLMRSTIPAMIELRSNFAADLPLVSVDPTHVHQIIVNLITNAAHAIGSRAGVIEVGLRSTDIGDESFTVRRLTPGRYVILDVKDNGTGMDHATKARIFDPFFTTKPVGEGTGLGLSVVDGIVRGHGGGITIYSELGKGTVFHIYFPIASKTEEAEKPRLAVPVPRGDNRHVLYVDDEESLVSLVTRNLTRLGYRVTGFTDSEAALREFASGPGNFDAIVTDLAMPRLSGFELLRQVLTLRPNIPAVMTSGYLRPEDEEMAQQIGVKQVILKPNTTEELGFALDALLRNTGKGSD
jgi:PAS domain S-box-containing protein